MITKLIHYTQYQGRQLRMSFSSTLLLLEKGILSCIYPNRLARNQIDCILINERFWNAMKRVWTYPGEDSGSDHILLVGYLRMDLKKLKCGKAEPKLQLKVLKDDAYVEFISGIRVSIVDGIETQREGRCRLVQKSG